MLIHVALGERNTTRGKQDQSISSRCHRLIRIAERSISGDCQLIGCSDEEVILSRTAICTANVVIAGVYENVLASEDPEISRNRLTGVRWTRQAVVNLSDVLKETAGKSQFGVENKIGINGVVLDLVVSEKRNGIGINWCSSRCITRLLAFSRSSVEIGQYCFKFFARKTQFLQLIQQSRRKVLGRCT